MKIAFYIDSLYRGGAQRVMSGLVNYMYEQGYEVVFIDNFVPDENASQYELSLGVKRVHLLKEIKGNPVMKNIKRVFNLRRVIKEEKPAAVVSFMGHQNVRMILATIGMQTPKIVSVRNDPNKEYGESNINKRLTGILFSRVDGCVFQTANAALYFPQYVRDKSCVIPNPIHEKFFQRNRNNVENIIISVGRLARQKNHHMLIDAFSLVAEKYSDYNLHIYGDGPLKEELEAYIAELHMKSRIKLWGNIINIEEKLDTAQLFVLSSDYEGMPNALMEAMAVGVPVISTDCPCGGAQDLLKKIPEAVFVPCNDAEKLSQAMDELLSSKEKQSRLSEAERHEAEKYRYGLIMKRWEEFILEVILS